MANDLNDAVAICFTFAVLCVSSALFIGWAMTVFLRIHKDIVSKTEGK